MSKLPREQRDDSRNFHIYGGLVSTTLVLFIARAVLLFETLVNSSKQLYDKMTIAILKAPVLFYDTNPVGRIINRFSGDVVILDELLPYVFVDTLQLFLLSAGTVIFTSALNPRIILAVVPLMIVFFVIGRLYNKTFREVRRLEALNRSPVFSHFSDTLEGLASIRAYKKETSFLEELYRFNKKSLSKYRKLLINQDSKLFYVLETHEISTPPWYGEEVRALYICQNWPASLIFSQMECTNFDNSSYSTSFKLLQNGAHYSQNVPF